MVKLKNAVIQMADGHCNCLAIPASSTLLQQEACPGWSWTVETVKFTVTMSV